MGLLRDIPHFIVWTLLRVDTRSLEEDKRAIERTADYCALKATQWSERAAAAEMALAECATALRAMVDEQVEYMTINHLGDPEAQHNIKRARLALARAGGKQ